MGHDSTSGFSFMLALCKNKPTRTLLQILSFPSTGPLVILTLISRILFSDLLFYYCLPVDLVALKHFQSNILSFCSRSAFVTVAPLMSFYSRFLRSCFLLLVHAFRGFPNFVASVPFLIGSLLNAHRIAFQN